MILTDVPAVLRGFGTEDEEEVRSLDSAGAEDLIAELAEGSMRPKVESSLEFVRATAGEALITSPAALADALAGRAGTRVTSA